MEWPDYIVDTGSGCEVLTQGTLDFIQQWEDRVFSLKPTSIAAFAS